MNGKKKIKTRITIYKPLTAGGKFMTFLQVLATLLLLTGLYMTLYYPLADYRLFLKAAILLISAMATLFMLFYSKKYRDLWKNLNNEEPFDPMIFTFAYYAYGIAIFFAFISLLYFLTSKKNPGRKGKIVYSIILIILAIGLMIANWFVQKDFIAN